MSHDNIIRFTMLYTALTIIWGYWAGNENSYGE